MSTGRSTQLEARRRWREGTVVSVTHGSERMITLRLQPREWIPHTAGQHYELRYPGEELSRAFSVASSALPVGGSAPHILEFGVLVRPRGMLTPRLASLAPGDRLEIRGPTGVAFAWPTNDQSPLILLGAGAGVTPLLAIARTRGVACPTAPLAFLLSVRSKERLYQAAELSRLATVRYSGTEGRLTRENLRHALLPFLDAPNVHARICGPSPFMKEMVGHLLQMGVSPERIRSEAFV